MAREQDMAGLVSVLDRQVRLMQTWQREATLRLEALESFETPTPHEIAIAPGEMEFSALRPRFLVEPAASWLPGAADAETQAISLRVHAGTWWREKVPYTWAKAALDVPAAYAEGLWYVLAKILPDETDTWVVEVAMVHEDDYPPEDVGQADYRVLAIVSTSGTGTDATASIWQRWFSDIYDGGTTFPSDWELERNTYQDSGMYCVDIGAGHFHWHGHLVKTFDDTTQLLVDTGTGYIYLSYGVAANTLSVVYTADFPESTSEVWNFMLYKFENGRVVRDLRTSINFGSPI